ncbi:uncharacterized protein [Musca autumnalis]|uniref:uncharacterized protein n=1 Tax=Musca autumnalis TaxID=221902 RepID=UPI003CF989B6
MSKHLLVSAVFIISCCIPSFGRYLGQSPFSPQPYNPYGDYGYSPSIGYPYQIPTSYYPPGTYFDQRRGILRPFPGGGVPIIVDYHKRCSGNYVGLKPHPEENQYYYVCKPDAVIFGRCQRFQQFNTTCGQCVQARRTEYEPKCTAEGRFPIHTDCHLYYKCDKSLRPQIYSCPHNMIFSQQTSKCIAGNACIPTQIIRENENVPEYCENQYPACQQNGVFRSPSDCSLYYTCELQENRVFYQTRFKCPGETFYDLQSNACLPKEQVPCDCISLAELVYPASHIRPYTPHISPSYPLIHPSEFDLDSLEDIKHKIESSSEEDDTVESKQDSQYVGSSSSEEDSGSGNDDEASSEPSAEGVIETQSAEAVTEPPTKTDDEETQVLGSEVDFGDRFVLPDDKQWNNGDKKFAFVPPPPPGAEEHKGDKKFIGFPPPPPPDAHKKHPFFPNKNQGDDGKPNEDLTTPAPGSGEESSTPIPNEDTEDDDEHSNDETTTADEQDVEEEEETSSPNEEDSGEESATSSPNEEGSGEEDAAANKETDDSNTENSEENNGNEESSNEEGESSSGTGDSSKESSDSSEENDNEGKSSGDVESTTDVGKLNDESDDKQVGHKKPCAGKGRKCAGKGGKDTQSTLHCQTHCSSANHSEVTTQRTIQTTLSSNVTTNISNTTPTAVVSSDTTTINVTVNTSNSSTEKPSTTTKTDCHPKLNEPIVHSIDSSTHSNNITTTTRDPTTNDVFFCHESSTLSTPIDSKSTKDWLEDFGSEFDSKSNEQTTKSIEDEFLPLGKDHTKLPKDQGEFGTSTPSYATTDFNDYYETEATTDDDDDDDDDASVLSDEIVIPVNGINDNPPTNNVIVNTNDSSTENPSTTTTKTDCYPKLNEPIVHSIDSSTHSNNVTTTTRDPTTNDVFFCHESSTLSTPLGHKSTKDWLEDFESEFDSKNNEQTTKSIEDEFLPLGKDHTKLPKDQSELGTSTPSYATTNFNDYYETEATTDDDDDDDDGPSVLSDEIVIPVNGINDNPPTNSTPKAILPNDHDHNDNISVLSGDFNDGFVTTIAPGQIVEEKLPSAKFLDPEHDDLYDDDESSELSDEIIIQNSGTEEPCTDETSSVPEDQHVSSTTVAPVKDPHVKLIDLDHDDDDDGPSVLSDEIVMPVNGTTPNAILPSDHNDNISVSGDFNDGSVTTIAPGQIVEEKLPSAKLLDPEHDDLYDDHEPSILNIGTEEPCTDETSPDTNEQPPATTVTPVKHHHIRLIDPDHDDICDNDEPSLLSDATEKPWSDDSEFTTLRPEPTGLEEHSSTDFIDWNIPFTTPPTAAKEKLPSAKLVDFEHYDLLDDDDDEPSVLSDEIIIPHAFTEYPSSKTETSPTPVNDSDISTTTASHVQKIPPVQLFDPDHDVESSGFPDKISITDCVTEEVTTLRPQPSGLEEHTDFIDLNIPYTTSPTAAKEKLPSAKLVDFDHYDLLNDDDDEPSVLSGDITIPETFTEYPSSETATLPATVRPTTTASNKRKLPSVKLLDPDHDDESSGLSDKITITDCVTEEPEIGSTTEYPSDYHDLDDGTEKTLHDQTANKKPHSVKLIDPDHDDCLDDDGPSVLSIPEEPTKSDAVSDAHEEDPSLKFLNDNWDYNYSSILPDDINKPANGTEVPISVLGISEKPDSKPHDPEDDDETKVLSFEIVIPEHTSNTNSPLPSTMPPTTMTEMISPITPSKFTEVQTTPTTEVQTTPTTEIIPPITDSRSTEAQTTPMTEIIPPITHSRSTEVQTTPTPTPKYLETTQSNNNHSEITLHFRPDGCSSELGNSAMKPSEQKNIYISLLNLDDTNKPVNNCTNNTNINQNTAKLTPGELKKANMPRLEIFVERPMDVRFVICPKTCKKDHKHNYGDKNNRAVHLKWYPNRSNQTMALETSNRLKIDG